MAAAPSSLGEQIREELSCSICLELFTKPKMLPCQHTFCQHCLLAHVGDSKKVLLFKCPNCREQVRLPPNEGIAGLPDNYLVKNLCERLQKMTLPAPERISAVQALIYDGRNILESFNSSIRVLEDTERTLYAQKEQTENSVIQACNQMTEELRLRKVCLLNEVGHNHRKNSDRIKAEKDRILVDVNELTAACDLAEQDLEQCRDKFSGPVGAVLTEVVEKYRKKAEPMPVQTLHAVFQPTDIVRPILGYVTTYSVPSTPEPHHSSSPTQEVTSSNNAGNCMPGHHVSKMQGEHQSEMVTFGGGGPEMGKFRDPSGVAVSDGFIFIADYLNQRIQVFTATGVSMYQFATIVSEDPEEKMSPGDVATDGEGNLWVVGRTGSAEFAVQYTKQGVVIHKIYLQYTLWGRGVAVDARRNHVLITETTGSPSKPYGVVLVFKADGMFVKTVGEKQVMTKYLRYVAVDKEGNILVSDWVNNCIYAYSEDGQLLLRSGVTCSTRDDGQLKIPCGICTDGENIIVANRGNNRVELCDNTGRFLRHITTDIVAPQAVAMTTQGQLVVTSAGGTVTVLNHTPDSD